MAFREKVTRSANQVAQGCPVGLSQREHITAWDQGAVTRAVPPIAITTPIRIQREGLMQQSKIKSVLRSDVGGDIEPVVFDNVCPDIAQKIRQ